MYDILLRDIRSQVAQFLTSRCTIQRPDQVVDEFGAATEGYTVIGSDVKCRLIQGDKPTAKEIGLQEVNRETYRLIVQTSVELATGYRVIVNGKTYEVISLRQELTDEVFHEALIGRLA